MRRFSVLVRATALEIGSEPLALLLTLSATALAFLAPRLNYHTFGDPTRMAMEAGCSAQLVLGLVFSVVCTIRTFRREIESGTLQMALAHSISRGLFFCAKTLGAFLAYLVFAATVFSVTVVVTRGAAIGAVLAREQNDVPVLFGPSVALATGAILLPLVLAAALNYFARFRFTLTATVLSLICSAGASLAYFEGGLWMRLGSLALLLACPAAILTAASAACAIRWRGNAATAFAGTLGVLLLPLFGNYYVPGALVKGGTLPPGYALAALAASVPLVAAFVLVGTGLFARRELGGD